MKEQMKNNKTKVHAETGEAYKLIEVTGLTKSFDDMRAVNEISFTIDRGEIFGFLGPNGAGKTTTINMLTGLARADSGSIHIAGFDTSRHPRSVQYLIGVVPDESNLYPELTGLDNLCFCASLYGVPKMERQARAWELIDAFNLSNAAKRK